MNRDQKQSSVDELSGKLRSAQLVILADYTGISVEKLNLLRRSMEKAESADVKVVKNTLFERAMAGTGMEGLSGHLKGPTAIIIGNTDPVSPVKVLNEFLKENKDKFKIKAGYFGGMILDEDGVKGLANLPSREMLLGQLLGTLQAPMAQLLGVLSAVPQQILGVLSAYEDERKKSEGAA